MESPCIKICKIDIETRICKGCGRTVEQITQWTRMLDEERTAVINSLTIHTST